MLYESAKYTEYQLDALEKLFNKQTSTDWRREKSIAREWLDSLTYSQEMSERIKMTDYKANGSNPKRIASSTSTLGKLLWRAYWCKTNWPEAFDTFKDVAFDKLYAKFAIAIDKEAAEAEDAHNKFEEEVSNADISKYLPTDRDWEKMIDYMNRKSVPQRLADSCKDANKIVSRFIIAKCLGWEECATAFKNKAIILRIATPAELEAYFRKYIGQIPEQYEGYIEALKEDPKSGLNTIGTDMDKIDRRIQKVFDDANNVESYQPFNTQVRGAHCVKFTTYNHEDYYFLYSLERFTVFGPYTHRHTYAGWYVIVDHEPIADDKENKHKLATIGDIKYIKYDIERVH